MQNTKDTFYLAMRDRLAVLNSARTVSLNGVTRPAVLVMENEVASAALPQPNAFYITWLGAQAAKGNENESPPLIELSCRIDYWTEGSSDNSYQDRGRMLAALDAELFEICAPPRAPLMDHSQSPAVTRGPNIFWTRPVLTPVSADGRRLLRSATLSIFTPAEFNC